jgi:hypothetical protein
VVRQVLPNFAVDVSHTKAVPDYSLDPWSAFPKFPDSGISLTFANNPSDAPLRVCSGAYTIPARASNGGFVPYPALQREFVYDGVSSLLLDFTTEPAPLSPGANGQQVYVMITSAPQPFVRAVTQGVANPSVQTQAQRADNAQTGMRFEFARVQSEALSGWLPAPIGTPDYQPPYPGVSIPAGASIEVEYRGDTTGTGGNATAWSTDINFADGMPFLQFRVTFRAATSGARPSLDSLVIPVN